MEIMILCLRPLPAANGGWSSVKWRTPKLAAPVTVRPIQVSDWLPSVSPQTRAELGPILQAPFVAAVRMEGPTTAFEQAIGYAGVVAEACAGVVVLGEELIADRRASVAVWSGPQIEERWRALDAEAARAAPDYQPVRDVNDDHRPTQSFSFPIVIDGQELTVPNLRTAFPAAGTPAGVPAQPARRAAGSEPPARVRSRTDTSEKTAPLVALSPVDAGEKTAPIAAPARTPTGREVPAVVTVPARTTTGAPRSRTASGERRAAQIKTQFDAAADEKTHDAVSTGGGGNASAGGNGGTDGNDDDWSDVMPD